MISHEDVSLQASLSESLKNPDASHNYQNAMKKFHWGWGFQMQEVLAAELEEVFERKDSMLAYRNRCGFDPT